MELLSVRKPEVNVRIFDYSVDLNLTELTLISFKDQVELEIQEIRNIYNNHFKTFTN